MAELYTLRPLFPGSSESDQLYKICSVLGTPAQTAWPDGFKLASQLGFRWPQLVSTRLDTIVPQANADAINIMYATMTWDPNHRISAAKMLSHPYFDADKAADAASSQLPQLYSSAAASSDLPPTGVRSNGQKAQSQASMNHTGGFGGGAGDSLFNPMKSWKEGTSNASGFYKADSSKGSDNGSRGSGFNLPNLPQEGRKSTGAGSGKKSPGQRYLQMARYKPGMEQQQHQQQQHSQQQQATSLPSVQHQRQQAALQRQAAAPVRHGLGGPVQLGLGEQKSTGLPDVGGIPGKPGYLGGHAARMLG